MVPAEASWSVSVVGDLERLLDKHVHAVVTELEFHHLRRKLEADRVGLGLDEEAERSVVDVVSDGSVERLHHLRAEDDVKASFLARWDDLAERRAAAELRELVDHEPHVDVLPQIV